MKSLFKIFLALFIVGCSGSDDLKLDKPPVNSTIPDDVPIAKSEPKTVINPELPPEPVTE